MTNGPSSEPQKAFIVAGAVLLGLPFILMLGMAAIVMAAGVGYIPGATSGLPSELTSELLLFFLGWSALSVVVVLIFVARVMKRSSNDPPR
jgi:membrane protein implicated in regulation of membrane protease activity